MLLKFVLPKGRQLKSIQTLLADAGIKLAGNERNYRPACNDPDLEIKMLKSQNIPPLLAWGRHDIGFAGMDWIEEQSADVVSVLDLGFDPLDDGSRAHRRRGSSQKQGPGQQEQGGETPGDHGSGRSRLLRARISSWRTCSRSWRAH